jgi:hypothetical protein
VNFSEVFGEAKQFYDQLSPQQRQMVVQQFKNHFGNSSDPQLQQQAQALDPNNPDPQQLGQMHDYAQQAAPDALNRVMDHPDLQQAKSQQGVSGWGGGYDPGRQYQSEQAGGYADQSGYSDQGFGQGASQSGQYGDRGGYRQDPGVDGTQDPAQSYNQPDQYGDRSGYRQDPGDYGDRDAYQQGAVGGREEYPPGDYSDGQPDSPRREQGYEQGGQYGQEDPYRQDQGGY